MMNLFSKLKQKKEDQLPIDDLTAMISGHLINIEEVNDEVFSQKMMGDGFAIVPDNNVIVAPAPGIISSVYPTGHAINIKFDNGVDAIIHIGIDTVELNGTGFKKKVSAGQKVRRGDELVELDKKSIPSRVDLTTMLIFPELKNQQLKKVTPKKVTEGSSIIGKIESE